MYALQTSLWRILTANIRRRGYPVTNPIRSVIRGLPQEQRKPNENSVAFVNSTI